MLLHFRIIIIYLLLFVFFSLLEAKRLINFDEIRNGIGSRPGAVMINENVNELGTPQHKILQQVSTIYDMNFAFEALPPYQVIQSTAENPRIEERFNNEMHHVIGNFRFSEIDGNIRSFSNNVSWLKDGSVIDAIFIHYIKHILCPLYKDAKDEERF